MLAFSVDGQQCGAWCTLQTAPRQERIVCTQLTALGIEHYAPEFASSQRTRPGSVRDRRRRWVFPGYVFFRQTEDASALLAIRWAPGVGRILGEDGVPLVVSNEVVQHLRCRIAQMGNGQWRQRFARGEPIVIERGPLAAVDAIFDCELDAPHRVQVLVQLMGRELRVRIDPDYLRSTLKYAG
jgi:transcription antitermination factor NusG